MQASHAAIGQIVQMAQEQLHPGRIWLFGSRGRGTHRPTSDIDLAFELDAQARRRWVRFKLEVEEHARTLLDVDLIDIERCSDELRASIMQEGKLLYSEGPASHG